MLFQNNHVLTWQTFELFEQFPQLVHGIFTRHEGVSQSPFDSLNVSFDVGDADEQVLRNRHRIFKALQINHCSYLKQIHGNQVLTTSTPSCQEADALTTSAKNLALLIQHADCQAAIFFDPIHEALSVVHSGWRGSVQNIYKNTVDSMRALYGTNPADLFVGVSPSLGPDAAQFLNYHKELPKSFHGFQSKPYYFDFWQITRMQLLDCGVLPHHLQIAEICTYHSPDFFSYRRDKLCGRNATIAML